MQRMIAIEWQPKAARQLRKIADKSRRDAIYDDVQQLAKLQLRHQAIAGGGKTIGFA